MSHEKFDPANDGLQLLSALGSMLVGNSISRQNSIKQNPSVLLLQKNFDLISII